jgi:hypothetical protein
VKRLIILQHHYHHTAEERVEAFKQFRSDLKAFTFIQIVKELEPKPEVIIEYPDNKHQEMYDGLRKLDVVCIIDVSVPAH